VFSNYSQYVPTKHNKILSTVIIKNNRHFFVVKNPSSGIWCGVIQRIRQWCHWTSLWESEKRPYIWELDADLRIGRRFDTGRRSESYISNNPWQCFGTDMVYLIFITESYSSFIILFFLTTIIFYSNACYNQLHKPKLLMKQYIYNINIEKFATQL
jgi:hypothetical protein